MIKNSIAGLVAGVIATGGVLGVSSLVAEDVVEPALCEQCQDGEQGPRGYTGIGVKGERGIQGVQGVQGIQGNSVTVEQVLAALDAREEVVEVEYNLADVGVGTSTVIALPKGTYGVSIFHAGADYFGASLNGHGRNIVFTSKDGYVSMEEDIEIVTEGEYTVNVTATGQWTFDIIKK